MGGIQIYILLPRLIKDDNNIYIIITSFYHFFMGGIQFYILLPRLIKDDNKNYY